MEWDPKVFRQKVEEIEKSLEPVAWVNEDDLRNIQHKHPTISRDKILDNDIPLYIRSKR